MIGLHCATVGVALRYPALGVINSLMKLGKFNFSHFGADFDAKAVKSGNAAVSLKNAAVNLQNEAVKSGNEAVNLQNEAVKWHLPASRRCRGAFFMRVRVWS